MTLSTALATAQPAPSTSPWVGVWLVHETEHSSYAGTVYRLDASGGVTITAMLDTNVHGRRPRQVGAMLRRRVVCRIGTRWRPGATPDEIVFAGACSDGRAREMVLTLAPPPGVPRSLSLRPRVLRVGRERGWTRPSWNWEMYRCDPNPDGRCADIERHQQVYHPSEAERDVRAASLP